MGAHSVVTVTIPSYNYARYLRECVESAVHQEGVEVDVVIVENASTDGSRELARRLRDEHPNVRLVEHADNHGIICSLNRCRDEIRGDYVVLLCADDCLTPGSLARSVAFMEAHPNVGMTYGPVIDFTHVSDVKPAQLAAAPGPAKIYPGAEWIDRVCRARENPIRTPEVLMRVSTLAVAGRLDPACPHTSDLNMWLRMASYADVAFLPGQILAMYRQHETNHSNAYEGSALSTIEQKWVAFSAFLDTVADRPERGALGHDGPAHSGARGPLLGVARVREGEGRGARGVATPPRPRRGPRPEQALGRVPLLAGAPEPWTRAVAHVPIVLAPPRPEPRPARRGREAARTVRSLT